VQIAGLNLRCAAMSIRDRDGVVLSVVADIEKIFMEVEQR
jgi:hypothetical protein